MPQKPKKKTDPPRPFLYPYQRRWVEDDSRFKIACKARQIGFTFAAAWRVVAKRLEQPGLTLWLSASERQAIEAMEYVRRFCSELQVVVECEDDFIEGMQLKRREVRFPNGSRVIGLPANPDTVRGFAGDIVLDEFAFHRDAEAIWRAAFATATRGYQIEIISTPNGARGKYYELARAAGLVDFDPGHVGPGLVPALSSPPLTSHESRAMVRPSLTIPSESRGTSHGIWSPHWVSLPHARAQGFVVDVESLRAAISDEDAWQQEYCCRFLTEAAHYLPPELVVAAEHPAATTSLPPLAVSGQRSVVSEGTAELVLSAAEGAVPIESSREVFRQGTTSVVPDRTSREAHPRMGSGENLVGFPQACPKNSCYLGVDIGRRRDLTVLWLLEVENPDAPPDSRRYCTRAVLTLERQPFAAQRRAIDSLLAVRASSDFLEGHGGTCPERSRRSRAEMQDARSASYALAGRGFSPDIKAAPQGATTEGVWGNPAWVSSGGFSFLIRRCAVDASGLGLMLAEELEARWGARVEPVTFTSAVKEDLAVRVKRLLEERRLLLPYDPVIRASLAAVKRYVTPAGNIRFDADRTDAGHADHFWALALALSAADDSGPTTDFLSSQTPNAFAHASCF